MLEIGSIVDGKYKILNKIGQGGMSVVYLAMNEKANKQWAIKEVRKDGIQNYEVVKQGLIAETDMLKKLSHSNLPSIIDVIDGEGTFLIVMDYIEGNSLSKALEESGAQPQEAVIDWAMQLCDVLGYLHSREPAIVYRDMKPANVMLKPDRSEQYPYGQISLIDFGTAREFKNEKVEDTVCLGTQGYAAPEQFGGQGQTDARTDIYCLGATMYHLLTSHNPAVYPYEMKPIREWNPALSSGLEEIILKCTRKNPNERYQNCNELLYALQNYDEQDIKFKKRQKVKLSVFASTLALAMVSGIVSGVAHSNEIKVQNQNYETLVKRADGTEAIAEAIPLYKEAITIDNTKNAAYEGFLDKLVLDNEHEQIEFLDKEEKSQIEDQLNMEKNGQSNLESFMNTNPEEAAEFIERYAKILMYDSGTEDGEAIDRQSDTQKANMYFEYLSELIESGDVSAEAYPNLDIYLAFLNYKQKAGLQGATESIDDEEYADYFRNLQVLFEEGEFAENQWQAASFYRDILTIINKDEVLRGFRSAGIADEEMIAFLEEINAEIQSEEFKNKIENSLFWKNGYSGEGKEQNLEEFLQTVLAKIKAGTDESK